MSRITPTLGWIVSGSMLIALAAICVLQWSEIEVEKRGLLKLVEERFLRFDRKLDIASSRWATITTAEQKHQMELTALVESICSGGIEMAAPKEGIQATAGPSVSEDVLPEEQLGGLPPIPKDIDPEGVVSRDLAEILADERLNPREKGRLPPVDGAEALIELTRAQGTLRVLESEILLEVTRGMQKLREKGEYVEYAPGERYEVLEGVKTAAEVDGEITRMFYLFPEQFPGIYERTERKAKTAEVGLRRLLRILQRK